MIRINLLPEKKRRKKKAAPIPPFYIYSVLLAAVAVLFLGIFTLHLNSKISELKEEKAVKEQKLAELKELLKEVENFERDIDAYKRKVAIIEQLRKNQDIPIRLLDEVSGQLPKGVWLTELVNRRDSINLSGYAFTNSELVSYVQNLKGSKYMTGVELIESRKASVGGVSLYKFKLTVKIKV